MVGISRMFIIPQIVDTHVHIWDREKMKVSWTKNTGFFDRNFTLTHYGNDIEGLHVRSVYMEVNADENSKQDELDYAMKLVNDSSNDLVGGIMYASPAEDDFKDTLNKYAENNKIKGIRYVLHLPEYPNGLCLREKFISGVRLLGQYDLTFDICIRSEEVSHVVELANKCPETVFILNHAGCVNSPFDISTPEGKAWNRWKSHINEIGTQNNVYCKLSGLVNQLPKTWKRENLLPILNVCLSSFPINRIIVGSDWPICTLTSTAKNWFETLHQLLISQGLSASEIKQIFSDNAASLYKLRLS